MAVHPEVAAEQAYIDYAYECLDAAREAATRLRSIATPDARGGTPQARYERDVIEESVRSRLSQLALGDEALCFGRIDHLSGERFYIGRLAIADAKQEPVVVDWRAPIAESFYRATGREPMGLARRRHFAVRGRKLLDLEDEIFGADRPDGQIELSGRSALIAAIEESRTGQLGDIVATIQAEQDEVIRGELPGVLVVQGGPGTGKTVVALHRAAYLLYTHRFPLEGQGVIVVGPNRLFLRYIERVLPSLGEAGVELATLADFIPDVAITGENERSEIASIKADLRMATVIRRAVRDRQRRLRADLVVGYGPTYLRLDAATSAQIVSLARRRYRIHNNARRFVEQSVYQALVESSTFDLTVEQVRDQLHGTEELRAALEWMWPVLTPPELLRDLFGSRALLASAARSVLTNEEQRALYRQRGDSLAETTWTLDDVALLDEARARLGPRPSKRNDDDIRTYGHIVVDEAQDLSPMQLRMLERRSLNGSMTIVGDIAQATGAQAIGSWDEVLEHLPDRRPSRRRELTLGYRIPSQVMDLAASVLSVAAPDLRPPRSVRAGEVPPKIRSVEQSELHQVVGDAVHEERKAVGKGAIAVIVADSGATDMSVALEQAGIDAGVAARQGLEAQVTVVPISLAKGLELDAAIVVEPARIVREARQGMRALYVALTRATKRLTIVHAEELPEPLARHLR